MRKYKILRRLKVCDFEAKLCRSVHTGKPELPATKKNATNL